MRMHKQIIQSDQIREINEANFVVRHFIDLSAKLLPFLAQLQLKDQLSDSEQQNKNKIIKVFNSYGFDTCTSKILMQSPILDIIKESYRGILVGEKHDIEISLNLFSSEYKRLKRNWENSELN